MRIFFLKVNRFEGLEFCGQEPPANPSKKGWFIFLEENPGQMDLTWAGLGTARARSTKRLLEMGAVPLSSKEGQDLLSIYAEKEARRRR
jgi:hypothetical protein